MPRWMNRTCNRTDGDAHGRRKQRYREHLLHCLAEVVQAQPEPLSRIAVHPPRGEQQDDDQNA